MAGNSKSDGYNSIFLVAFKQRDIEDGVCSTQLLYRINDDHNQPPRLGRNSTLNQLYK
jgi:hypothetical protein